MRPLRKLAVAIIAASLAWTLSHAVDYPTRPVRIIVGFAAPACTIACTAIH